MTKVLQTKLMVAKLADILNKRQFLSVVLLVGICTLVFSSALNNGFVWDDFDFIVNWQALRAFPSNTYDLLSGSLPSTHAHAYRPLRSIYYGTAFRFFHLEPQLYHLLSIVVHTAVVVTIFLSIKKITKSNNSALLGSLLFGLHPSNSEAVYWITASFDSIGSLFFFLSLYFFISFRQKVAKSHPQMVRQTFYVVSVLCAGIAFYSYELTLTLPAILALYDYLHYKKLFRWKTFFPYLLLNSGYWFMRFVELKITNDKPPVFESTIDNLLLVPLLIFHYVKQTFFPLVVTVNHQLKTDLTSFFYADYNFKAPPLPPTIFNLQVLSGIVLLMLVVVGFIKWRQKFPPLIFAGLAFFVTLVPVLQLFPRSIIFSERYLYLGIGIATIFITKVVNEKVPRRRQTLLAVVTSCLLVGFAYKTHLRGYDWKNGISLWTASAQTTPKSMTMYRNLSDAYNKDKQFEKTIETAKKGIEINPNNYTVYSNLASGYLGLQELDLALGAFEKVLELNPNDVYAYVKVGDIYYVKNNPSEAIKYYRMALNYPSNYTQYLQLRLVEITSDLEQAK